MRNETGFEGALGVTIFGVGGAGGNAVAQLLDRPRSGMNIVCANTDMQALRTVPVANRLQLGRRLTSGLGAGARPEVGRAAAEEALPLIHQALEGTSLCFVAAGLGGGTGTGAAPVIAGAARKLGILTIGVATRPFAFEGKRRSRIADAGALDFAANVDAMVVVCNENLFRVIGQDTTLRDALRQSDAVICESAANFTALVDGAALKRINIADLRGVFTAGGQTVMGYGEHHSGADRATRAAQSALRNPLLEGACGTAERLLVTVSGGEDLRLFEVEEAIEYLHGTMDPDTEIVWGSVIDPALGDRVRVGIAATGLSRPADVTKQSAPGKLSTLNVMQKHTVDTVAATTVAEPCQQDHAISEPSPAIFPCSGSFAVHWPTDEQAAEPIEEPSLLIDDAIDVLQLGDECAMRSTALVRRRTRSASLVDRIYFACKDVKRKWRKQPGITATLSRRLSAT